MHSTQPVTDCEDVEHREAARTQLFAAGCHPTHILHPAEGAFDEIAHRVGMGRGALDFEGMTATAPSSAMA